MNTITGSLAKKSLKAWFLEFRDWLKDNGFVLVIYSVPKENVIRGEFQCAFIPSHEKTEIGFL